MLLTVKLKMKPTDEQKQVRLSTMERFNAACNHVSKVAFEEKTFGKVKLQHKLYYYIRERFGLFSHS